MRQNKAQKCRESLWISAVLTEEDRQAHLCGGANSLFYGKYASFLTKMVYGAKKERPMSALFLPVGDQICLFALILTPGPIVDAVTQVRMYWPFAAVGLALMMAAISAA